MFTFQSLVQLLLPMVQFIGVSQPISIEYKMVHGLNQAVLQPKISKTRQSWTCPVFSYVLEHVSEVTMGEKKLDYLCNCKSEISNICNAVEGHCLHTMKVVRHHANGLFDWLISGH